MENDYNVRLSRIAMEMGRLFIPRHDVQQIPEYEELRLTYLQILCDMAERDKFDPPEYKDFRHCG